MPSPHERPRVVAVTTDLAMTGSKRVLVDGACGVDRRRFEPHVLLFSDVPPQDPLRRELESAGVPVHHVRVRARVSPRGLRDLARWIDAEGRPDLLHTHCARSAGIVRLCVALRRRAPRPAVVVHFHGTVSRRALRPTNRVLDRLLRPWTDLVLAPTVAAAVRGGSAHSYRGLPARVVYNGVDLARVARAVRPSSEVRRAWCVPEDSRVVLLLGRWDVAKGHDVLLDAIPSVLAHPEPVRFVLVAPEGGGSYRRGLEQLVRGTALRRFVVMTGRDTDPGSCYAAADVVAMPSRDEPFGLVAVEAMGAGRTLVVARAGGLPEVCGDEDAVVWVPPDDPDALGRAILGVLSEDARTRAARGERARARAARFGLPAYVHHLETAYADALGRPDLRPPGPAPEGARDVEWSRT